jgi:lipid A disaccharide synthetase
MEEPTYEEMIAIHSHLHLTAGSRKKDIQMNEPIYDQILKGKIDHYGETKAAYQFAAEEYARQWFVWMSQQMERLQCMKSPTNKDVIVIYPDLRLTAQQLKIGQGQ